MKDKEKTQHLLEALIKYHTAWGRSRTNVLFPELRLGSGYCGVAQRRIDLFMISSNEGNATTAFEIKVSKQDFKHDIDNDLKQRGARLYSNYFYYVAPMGLIKPEDIPIWAGLMEFNLDEYLSINNYSPRIVVPAPLHSKAQPSWGLICSMVRHINKDCGKQTIADLQNEIKTLKGELRSAKALLKKIGRNEPYQSWEIAKYL